MSEPNESLAPPQPIDPKGTRPAVDHDLVARQVAWIQKKLDEGREEKKS